MLAVKPTTGHQPREDSMRHGRCSPLILILVGMIGASPLARAGVFTWNTFLGGTNLDMLDGNTVDPQGNSYLTGTSLAGWGNPLVQFSGSNPVWVAKVDVNGNLLWNTFWGSPNDSSHAIAVDGSGNVLICGDSFATWGNPVRAFGGYASAFVAKLSPGGALLWNTFLGLGPASGAAQVADYCRGIAVDPNGNVYVAGFGNDPWGSPVSPWPGGTNTWVAKLDANGNLLWNTYFGGSTPASADDPAAGLVRDTAGNLYVAGISNEAWGTPLQPFGSGGSSLYLVKLDPNGNLLWSTFFGGGLSFPFAAAIDGAASVYVVGFSQSTWGNPILPFAAPYRSGFLAKLDTSGTLLWNTFLGGTANTENQGVALDKAGNLYVGGGSEGSWGTPTLPYVAGAGDNFVARLDASTGALLGNAFFGGGDDFGASPAVDGLGNIYLAGGDNVTWGSPVRPYSGNEDVFVARLPAANCLLGTSQVCLSHFGLGAQFGAGQLQGEAHVVPLTTDTSYLWFFDPNNIEIVVKVIDGCALNGHFWVFAGGLTNVEVAMTLTDATTGEQKVYRNPPQTPFAPIQDTSAFPCTSAAETVSLVAAASRVSAPSDRELPAHLPLTSLESGEIGAPTASVQEVQTDSNPPSMPSAQTLGLFNGHFAVGASYSAGVSGSGTAQVVPVTADTGYLWFFDPNSVEAVFKIIDGCSVDGHYWFFAGGLTNVGVTITVTDTRTNIKKVYRNPRNTVFEPIQDARAFATCP